MGQAFSEGSASAKLEAGETKDTSLRPQKQAAL
jgi:hypothetical protein